MNYASLNEPLACTTCKDSEISIFTRQVLHNQNTYSKLHNYLPGRINSGHRALVKLAELQMVYHQLSTVRIPPPIIWDIKIEF